MEPLLSRPIQIYEIINVIEEVDKTMEIDVQFKTNQFDLNLTLEVDQTLEVMYLSESLEGYKCQLIASRLWMLFYS